MNEISFWDVHGAWFCLFIALWPRLVIAFIGTALYWDTNPVLCSFVWVWAIISEHNSIERRLRKKRAGP